MPNVSEKQMAQVEEPKSFGRINVGPIDTINQFEKEKKNRLKEKQIFQQKKNDSFFNNNNTLYLNIILISNNKWKVGNDYSNCVCICVFLSVRVKIVYHLIMISSIRVNPKLASIISI